MKKILYIINSLEIGGTEKHLINILPHLKKKNLNILVFCIHKKGILAGVLKDKNVKLVFNKKHKNIGIQIFYLLLKINMIIKKFNPDIIHMFFPESYLMGGFFSFLYPKIKFLMSRRCLNFYQKKYPLVRFIESFLHKKMTLILGNSSFVIRQLIKEGVPKSKLRLIYNGVDVRKFILNSGKNELRLNLGLQQNELLFVIVSNLHFYKGHIDLFKALSIIKSKLPLNWRLLVIGENRGEKENLIAKAKKENIIKNISFLGSRNDIPEILRASDIGISASHEEGFSNSVLEMMASTLPIIVTNAGGNSEAIGNTGIIVSIKNPVAISKAILKLLDRDFRIKLGLMAYERVKEKFSMQESVNQYEKIYREL